MSTGGRQLHPEQKKERQFRNVQDTRTIRDVFILGKQYTVITRKRKTHRSFEFSEDALLALGWEAKIHERSDIFKVPDGNGGVKKKKVKRFTLSLSARTK